MELAIKIIAIVLFVSVLCICFGIVAKGYIDDEREQHEKEKQSKEKEENKK